MVSILVCVCRCLSLSLFIRRLKMNHKSHGSYTFILEDGTATNSYSSLVFHKKNPHGTLFKKVGENAPKSCNSVLTFMHVIHACKQVCMRCHPSGRFDPTEWPLAEDTIVKHDLPRGINHHSARSI
jgi:hypothetical protein